MTWRPKTYEDYKLAGGEPLLNEVLGAFNKVDRLYAGCPCKPDVMKPAFVIVDCRHIDSTMVTQDWACDTCWTSWIRAAGKTERVLEELELRLATEPDEDVVVVVDGHPIGQLVERADRSGRPGRPAYPGHTVKRLRELLSTPGRRRRGRVQADIARELKENGLVLSKTSLHSFTNSQWIEAHGGPIDLVDRHRGSKSDFR